MFIGVYGGFCAGKDAIANILKAKEQFTRLHLVLPEHLQQPPLTQSSSELPKVQDLKRLRRIKAHEDEDADDLVFNDPESLLDHVTEHWHKNWITTEIDSMHTVDLYSKRPFFMLVAVDAPVTLRFDRLTQQCNNEGLPKPNFEEFIQQSDAQLYGERGLASIYRRASIHIINNSTTLKGLETALDSLGLSNDSVVRPSWDQYFMQLASLASHRSNCMKRRVGCVLVREKRVISTGYNGTPRGMKNCGEGGCPRCNSSAPGGTALDTCLCLHAEENALLEAGRERIREGATLYCDTCPCLTCSVKIAQVGISEVVYSKDYAVDSTSARILREAGVNIRQFSPPGPHFVNVRTFLQEPGTA